MIKTQKKILTIITLLLTIFAISSFVYSNSAEPPSILIIVPNAPDSLEISMTSSNEYAQATKVNKTIEVYYVFYSRDLRNMEQYNLKVVYLDKSFEITIDTPLESYNNIFTLNLENQTLTSGKSVFRTITLVSLRLIMTLIIEAVIFWLFGYRLKKSWLLFLAINLLTQGFLNIWLNGFSPMMSYIVLSLIFAEILIFIIEIVFFSGFVKEHTRSRAIIYVLVANLFSLIAGGYIITILPI